MTLRIKNVLIIIIIFIILFILGYIIPSRIILNEYLKSEKRFVVNNVERFNLLLNQEVENLDRITSDWAYWDDTYNFIQTKSDFYIESNLLDETFINLKLNYMIFFDKNINLVYKKFYNLILEKEEDFPIDLLKIIKNIINNLESNIEDFKGIQSIDSQVMIFSIKKITTSDLKSTYNGYISMGYLLTPEKIWSLSKILGYPINLFAYNYKYLPKDFEIAKNKLNNIDIYTNPVNNNNLDAYFSLKDIFNNDCAIIKIGFQRDIYSQGKATLNYFLILFLTIGLVLINAFRIILRRTMLNPIIKAIDKMKTIADKLDFTERLEVKGKDEIAYFNSSINKIFENFKNYEEKIKESERKYRSLFENAVEGVFQTNLEGKIINANRSFIKMLGYDSFEEIKKLNVKQDIYFDSNDRNKLIDEINKKGFLNNIELNLKKKDGSKIIVLENSRVVKDDNGNTLFFEGMFTDITKLKKYQEKLSFRIKLERLINEITLELISINDENFKNTITKNIKKLGEILFFDRIYILILSEDNQKVDGFYEWNKNGFEIIKNNLYNIKLDNIEKNKDMVVINKENKNNLKHPLFDYSFEGLILIPLIYGSSIKGFIGFENLSSLQIEYDDFIKLFLRIFSDIFINTFERIKHENNLKFISLHDLSTGLYNRFYFEEELNRLSKSRNPYISIILCDIDNLKFINDSFGHDIGDKIIVEVANILKKLFREEDIIARIGGDEFVILLQNIDENIVKNVIKRIYEEINTYSSKVDSLSINVSIGYSILKEKDKDPFITYKEADDMMYSVKISKKDLDKDTIIEKLKNNLILRGSIDKDLIENMKNIALDFSNYLSLSEESKEKLINLIEYHDIGLINLYEKVSVPYKLSLSLDYKRHPHIGYRIVLNSKRLSKIGDLILKHHEEYNGEGFPFHLKGDEIPFECKIFSVLYSYCSYKNLDDIYYNKGIKFDPDIVDKFISFIKQYYKS